MCKLDNLKIFRGDTIFLTEPHDYQNGKAYKDKNFNINDLKDYAYFIHISSKSISINTLIFYVKDGDYRAHFNSTTGAYPSLIILDKDGITIFGNTISIITIAVTKIQIR